MREIIRLILDLQVTFMKYYKESTMFIYAKCYVYYVYLY